METKLNVELINHSYEPEKLVAAAAKLCYSNSSAKDLKDGLTDEAASKFLDRLMDYGHASPAEHASFTFAIDGVSRSLTHQLVRHRIASYSQKSQRYVSEGQFEYIIPPHIKNDEKATEIYIKTMADIQESYDSLVETLTETHIKTMIDEGKDEKTAKRMASKKAMEDARYLLPNGCETKIVVTMNTRSLLNFFEHRCCERAQWEIRELAKEMLILVHEVAPNLFKKAGPACTFGPCTEGTMTCGLLKEVRAEYRSILKVK